MLNIPINFKKVFIFLCVNNIFLNSKAFNHHEVQGGRDTVNAIVLDTNFRDIPNFEKLSATQILHFIDSLLELDKIPGEWLQALNAYIEEKYTDHDQYVSLIGYASEGDFPADEWYAPLMQKDRIHPLAKPSLVPDSICLKIVDTLFHCGFHMPIQGVITSKFGWRDGKMHNGMDIDLEVWEPVYAAFDGVVRFAGRYKNYGRVVIIRHFNGLETLYAHLHRIKVQVGEEVRAGQIVGLGGSSGNSTGSHLHFEIRFLGIPINPAHIIDWQVGCLFHDEFVLKMKGSYQYIAFPKNAKFHVVKKGDSLFKIAYRYGLSLSQLLKLNNLHKRSKIYPGDKLLISM